jgi:lysozyme
MYDNSKGRIATTSLRPSGPLVDFIKREEALRLKAYQDQGGVWTIGWGHTGGVTMGQEITEEQATSFLKADLAEAAHVLAAGSPLKLFQHEYDALVSFIFNIGAGQFVSSTLRRALKMGRYDLAADEFKRWNKVKGKISNGLKKRRWREEKLFREALYRA